LKNINNIPFNKIKNYLLNNNINLLANIPLDENFVSLNSIKNANRNDLTFFSNNSSVQLLKNIKSKACLINSINAKLLPKITIPIIVDEPYMVFALLSNLFSESIKSNGIISNFTSVDKSVKIDSNVQIDSFVNIKANSCIHKNVIIESNCSVGPNVTILENTIIKANTVLLNCHIGSNCIIKSGAIIGGTGFGFDPVSKERIQHTGNVIIENNCNIGSNTSIDRAVFDSTIISNNCFIDNLVQIAHNVIIGKGAIIAAQSGIAGSTIIGENVTIGGQAGISGHLHIGNNVTIAGKSGVTKNIENNNIVAGFPAVNIKKWKMANIKLYKNI
jgi:UDP-3-O-[3-hydroxymyristoyl] glucosamine N-acyltransferase